MKTTIQTVIKEMNFLKAPRNIWEKSFKI